MIRLLLFLLFSFPFGVGAACLADSTTIVYQTYSCYATDGYGDCSPSSALSVPQTYVNGSSSFTFLRVIGHTSFVAGYSGPFPVSIVAEVEYVCSNPAPVCPDGSAAPNGDVAQCVFQKYCPDGSLPPFGDLSQCVQQVYCPDGSKAPFNNMGLCSPDATTSSTIIELNKINSSVVGLNSGLSVIASRVNDLNSRIYQAGLDIVSGLGNKIDHAAGLLGAGLNKIEYAIVTARYGIQGLLVEAKDIVTQVHYDLQNLPYNMLNAFDSFIRDRTLDIQQTIINAADQIYNGVTGVGSQTTVGGADPYSPQILASIDNLTTKFADFITGETSALSTKGTAVLAEGVGENPLGTPDEKDLSTIIKTTVSGGGACPASATADVMGHTITFSYQPMCDWADIVGKFIMIIAAMISIRIIASGGF